MSDSTGHAPSRQVIWKFAALLALAVGYFFYLGLTYDFATGGVGVGEGRARGQSQDTGGSQNTVHLGYSRLLTIAHSGVVID